jgi:hypothetical protein
VPGAAPVVAAAPRRPSTAWPPAAAGLTAANPVACIWQIDVVLRLTVSGNEFNQMVTGHQ